LGARADERHVDVELALDELHVAPRRRRQVVDRRAGVERLLPARQRLVDGTGGVEVALVRREVSGLDAASQRVANADRELGEMREHVELRERELVDAVYPNGVAESDEVEPAAAPAAACDRAVLAAELAHPILV